MGSCFRRNPLPLKKNLVEGLSPAARADFVWGNGAAVHRLRLWSGVYLFVEGRGSRVTFLFPQKIFFEKVIIDAIKTNKKNLKNK